jgi:hypothetical protein
MSKLIDSETGLHNATIFSVLVTSVCIAGSVLAPCGVGGGGYCGVIPALKHALGNTTDTLREDSKSPGLHSALF